MGGLATSDRDRPDRRIVAFLFLVHGHAHKRHARSIRRNLRIADPDEIEEIFLGDVAFLSKRVTDSRDQKKANDEARMSNDEGMTKPKPRRARSTLFRHLVIRHYFELRHSDFVIFISYAR